MKVAAPVYLDWSDEPITFDRADHPDHVPSSGKHPLVVDPVIDDVRLTKVLMDGGSSLNIIYAGSLRLICDKAAAALRLSFSSMRKSRVLVINTPILYIEYRMISLHVLENLIQMITVRIRNKNLPEMVTGNQFHNSLNPMIHWNLMNI